MADNSQLVVAALRETDPELAASVDASNSWQAAIEKRGARVKKYRAYERGDHDANITDQMERMLRIKEDTAGLDEFNDNYMRVIVDKFAGRVFVSNITVDGGDEAEKWLKETLVRNSFDAQQNTWYRGGIRDGDSYIMVDPVAVRWTSEPAFDGFSGIVVIYDDLTRAPIWACKLWSEADNEDIAEDGSTKTSTALIKIVVYQPDKVSFWKGVDGGAKIEGISPIRTMAELGNIDEVQEGNAIPWPLGRIPIITISNQTDNYTVHGESELRPAIPLQNVLNRTLHSMVMASEMSAFKFYWSIGIEVNKDDILPGSIANLVLKDSKGNIITKMGDKEVEFLKACKVGQFEESDISQYTNQIEVIVKEISQATQTPIYGVTTQGNLSGEALKQLEIGLLAKIIRFQNQNTDAIKDLIRLTAEIQNTFDNDLGEAPAFEDVMVIWKDAEILDVNERLLALMNMREKSPGLLADSWYIKRIGVLLGMSPDEIKEATEEAANQNMSFFESFVGAGGETVPAA